MENKLCMYRFFVSPELVFRKNSHQFFMFQAAMKLLGSSGIVLDISDFDMKTNQDLGMSFLWESKNYKGVRIATIFEDRYLQEKKVY